MRFFFFFFLFVSDIDECKVYGMCSQDCQNTKGSYKCLCKAGYQLEPDKKTCKAKGNFLLVIFLCVLMNSNCLWDYGVFMGLKNVYIKFSCCHISCRCWLGSSAHPQMCLF